MNYENSSWKRQFIFDISIAILVLCLPFSMFLHLLFSSNKEHIYILDFAIDHGFPDNQVFALFVLTNFINFFYLILIYLFTRGYWRIFILPAIYHFLAYPIWMFAVEKMRYFEYISSWPSLLIFVILLCVIISLDTRIGRRKSHLNIYPSNNQIWQEIILSGKLKFNNEIRRTVNNKPNLELKEYVYRIYYFNQLAASNENRFPSLRRQQIGNSIKDNSILGLTMILLSALLLIHFVVPSNVNFLQFGSITIGSFGFKDFGTFIYYTSQKFVLLNLSIIWFVFNPYWWRWAILSPIIFYSYQFWEGFQTTSDLESSGNLSVFPLVFLTIAGVFLLSRVIRRISINLDYQEFLEEELENSIAQLSRDASGRWVNMKESRI